MQDGGVETNIEGATAFRSEVVKEIDREEKMLKAVSQPGKGITVKLVIAIIILVLAVVLLFINPVGYLLWLMIAFILRSFYWIIWFIPTTRDKADKSDKTKLNLSSERIKRPVIYILKNKKKLGVEVGMTMLVTGMAPLAISNFILFGIGIGLGVYFGIIRGLYDYNTTLSVLFQMGIILVTFVLMSYLKPHERGLVRTVRKIKGGYSIRRNRRKFIALFILAVSSFIIALIGFIFVLSMFAPGGTWQAIQVKLEENGLFNVYLLIVILIIELILLRFFQGVSSKKMVIGYLKNRIYYLKEEALVPVDKAIEQAHSIQSPSVDTKMLEDAKRNFYSTIVYDIFEHNVFGYSRVYVIGPKLTFLLNEEALRYVQ
jgi:hypothetical protein